VRGKYELFEVSKVDYVGLSVKVATSHFSQAFCLRSGHAIKWVNRFNGCPFRVPIRLDVKPLKRLMVSQHKVLPKLKAWEE
jgi:hypothetical protein